MARLIRTALLSVAVGGAWYIVLVSTAFGLTLALDDVYATLGVSPLLSTLTSMAAGVVVATAVVSVATLKVRARIRRAQRDSAVDVEAVPAPVA